jgi:predicted nucleic acid-binding protein
MDKTNPSEIVTSSIVLFEVYRKIKQARDEQNALAAVAAIGQTLTVPVDQTIALEAADYSLMYGLHMVDAIIYATARHFEADLYTSDEDLKQVNGVIYI